MLMHAHWNYLIFYIKLFQSCITEGEPHTVIFLYTMFEGLLFFSHSFVGIYHESTKWRFGAPWAGLPSSSGSEQHDTKGILFWLAVFYKFICYSLLHVHLDRCLLCLSVLSCLFLVVTLIVITADQLPLIELRTLVIVAKRLRLMMYAAMRNKDSIGRR